jgi:hypothetical protein
MRRPQTVEPALERHSFDERHNHTIMVKASREHDVRRHLVNHYR